MSANTAALEMEIEYKISILETDIVNLRKKIKLMENKASREQLLTWRRGKRFLRNQITKLQRDLQNLRK